MLDSYSLVPEERQELLQVNRIELRSPKQLVRKPSLRSQNLSKGWSQFKSEGTK